MNQIVKRLGALLSVKSVVTILLTLTFVYLAVTGAVSAEQVMTVYTAVIAFYFGTQAQRVNEAIEKVLK